MIDPQISEWISQLLRWVHVITAIAWIGSSFYFIHLDLSLKKRDGLPAGVGGEAWQVHGGGFYNMRKYLIAPPEMPERADLVQMGELQHLDHRLLPARLGLLPARRSLHDRPRRARSLAPWQAARSASARWRSVGSSMTGLCRSPLGRNTRSARRRRCSSTSWPPPMAFTHLFSGRAAFLHTGAMIATWMSASVFFVIIPNQKKVVAALLAGADSRSRARPSGEATLDAQQLPDAAGHLPDAVEPLSARLVVPLCGRHHRHRS